MAEGYEILFRPEVEGDLSEVGGLHRRRIFSAIESRLSKQPGFYGKPLGGRLAGLRRVRVGDFRVAYQISGKKVVIWAVIHRKTIYSELAKRLGQA